MDGRMCGWAVDRCVGRLNVCMAGCTDKSDQMDDE